MNNMILNKKLEEKSSEGWKGPKAIIILVLLILIMMGTILYMQYQNMNMTNKCNTFWKEEIKNRCPTQTTTYPILWRGINATM